VENRTYVFTSESVTEGHPDKMADQISDGILDAILAEDPKGRVAVETLLTTGLAMVAGEVTTTTYVDVQNVVRNVVKDIGYTDAAMGFDYQSCSVLNAIHEQSPDISQGVTEGIGNFDEQGAGDQGLMFGYATKETPEYMPLPITLSHKITKKLAEVRKSGQIDYIGPDGKAQVTIEYKDGIPQYIPSVVVASQHREGITHDRIKADLIEQVVRQVIPEELLTSETKYYVNETGAFVMGGPHADAGVTGRKIIVDTYGGVGSHGGGAFSGKDPSKVDRSGSYMARYVAKNIVAAGLAGRCEVQVAYAIGVPHPISVLVDTKGTGAIEEAKIEAAVKETFDFRPKAIITNLDLLRPIYRKTAAYGHFGRSEPEFSWEKTDKTTELKERAGL